MAAARPLQRAFLPAVFLLFTASGFAGLIYESIWSHYLKLFLGHAAYAQTLVLAIFMGGMALGAWGASRLSARLRDLLLAYALVEAAVGLLSIGFHRVFLDATAFAFDEVIPDLGAPFLVQAFKWTLASLLILPQSVLLGATFPLLTGGVLRASPGRAGYVVAMLYFTNSLGAAVGVLASGFYFIAQVGLPGTLIAAGIVNLAVAALVILVRPDSAAAPPAPAPPAGSPVKGLRLLLAVACLTGFSSFLYEVGWIRMLSLVLGASTHSFELMLSAFILGIAAGGLWVRRRIDASPEPARLLGAMQLAMGLAALATLPVYGSSFVAMEAAMQALTRTDGGYVAFNFFSHGIALAVMFPAAFFAGTTLPLITAALLRRGAGEAAVGRVYAANTAGAIAGVAAAVHLGFPFLGLKGLIVAGAAIDLALGVALLGAAGWRWRAWGTGAAAIAVVLAVAFGPPLDAQRMASGVYRVGKLPVGNQQHVELQLDGKTATVSVARNDNALALLTNGKSDGAITMNGGTPSDDEIMMTLLGALPLVLAPEARRVANIGFGTGMTTHVLLSSERLESVDTIEIEPAMVRAAPLFRPFNARALDDPRSRVFYEDAKTFFASRRQRYDVIVSEPSNPWVSGIASLFSIEFYREARRNLKDGGLLLQWIQAYEMSPALLASILHALEASFPEYELWIPSHGDLIIVAANGGPVPAPDPRAFASAGLRAELARFQIRNVDDLLLHRIGSSVALGPYFATYAVPANSDFFPYLDLQAQQARFEQAHADTSSQLLEMGLPLFELFDANARTPDPRRMTQGVRPWIRRAAYVEQARAISAYLRQGEPKVLDSLSGGLASDAVLVRGALVDCRLALPPSALRDSLASLAWVLNQHLALKEREAVWGLLEASRCVKAGSPERAWLRLHAAVGAANPAAMASASAALLEEPGALPTELLARVVATRIAGLTLDGKAPQALRESARYRGKLGRSEATQILFRFLLAQANNPDQPRPAGPPAK